MNNILLLEQFLRIFLKAAQLSVCIQLLSHRPPCWVGGGSNTAACLEMDNVSDPQIKYFI